MKIINQELWDKATENNSGTPYGARILSYAEDWADEMESNLTGFNCVADVAQDAATRADYDGITGFMHGCAAGLLAECWEHGDELRAWHNSETQIDTEGDEATAAGKTLNPALITLKTKT